MSNTCIEIVVVVTGGDKLGIIIEIDAALGGIVVAVVAGEAAAEFTVVRWARDISACFESNYYNNSRYSRIYIIDRSVSLSVVRD
jgi:hypothetical protein